MSQTQTQQTTELFYPTGLKQELLEYLARYDVLSPELFTRFLYPDLTNETRIKTVRGSIRRALRHLRRDTFIYSKKFNPQQDEERIGSDPQGYWLSKKGAQWAAERMPATDPKPHSKYRSPNTIPHDLERAEQKHSVIGMCENHSWQLGWKKTNLFHLVKPDDFYEITATKTFHFFNEQERGKKTFKAEYDKHLPYVELHGTAQFTKLWGFAYFNVITPMRDFEAMQNLLTHFAGKCNCIDPKFRKLHKNAPYKLASQIIYLTTHEFLTTKTEAKILYSPADPSSPVSFLDIIR
jgi:hypothetical protein